MTIFEKFHEHSSSPNQQIALVRGLSYESSKNEDYVDLKDGYNLFIDDSVMQIIFQSTGCKWRENGSCAMCNYGKSTHNLGPNDIHDIFNKIIIDNPEIVENNEEIILDTFGSILDSREVSDESFEAILDNVSCLPCKKVVFETRPETVTEDKIKQIKQSLRSDQKIWFEFGIENEDSETNSRVPIGKEFSCDWREKVNLIHQNGCFATANIIIGVPFYSVESRNHAAVNSAIECNNYFDKIGLFPVNIKPNTLIDQLHKEGSYEPTSRWDIVSVLSKLDPKILEKIFLAYYGNKGPDVNIKPTDCFDCHDELEDFFDNFIKESDGNKRKEMVSDLINQHHCKCQIK